MSRIIVEGNILQPMISFDLDSCIAVMIGIHDGRKFKKNRVSVDMITSLSLYLYKSTDFVMIQYMTKLQHRMSHAYLT